MILRPALFSARAKMSFIWGRGGPMSVSTPAARKVAMMSAMRWSVISDLISLSLAALVCDQPKNQFTPITSRETETPPTVVRRKSAMRRPF